MASKKTPVEKLGTAISKILDDYSGSVQENLDVITRKFGSKGATALRQTSKDNFKQHTGEYAKGWKYEYRSTRRYAKTTIFNDHYSLPHLLENSHVIRNGTGRKVGEYKGREHIKPIADALTETYLEEVIKGL